MSSLGLLSIGLAPLTLSDSSSILGISVQTAYHNSGSIIHFNMKRLLSLACMITCNCETCCRLFSLICAPAWHVHAYKGWGLKDMIVEGGGAHACAK